MKKNHRILWISCAIVLALATASIAATLASTVPIKGSVLDVKLAKYDPAPAESGGLVTVWFDVKNLGIEKAANATFVIIPEYPFSLPNGDPERVYGSLTGLDDIRLEYKILVDESAPNGTYYMKMKYSTEGKIFSEETFGITVSEESDVADLKALFVKVYPPAFPGKASRLSIDVINADSGTAYYTLVKASSDIADIERDNIFVGTLEANDFDSVDFDMKIRDVEPGIYPVSIKMIYKDKDSVEHEESSEIYVRVGSREELAALSKTDTPVLMYVAYIIVFVLAIRLLLPFLKWLVKPMIKKKGSE